MKKFYRIILYSFLFLSIITLFANFFVYGGISSLIYSLFAFMINFSLAFLLIFFLGKTGIYKKKYFEPAFFSFLSFLVLWYVLNSILFLFNKEYPSRTSISYFISFLTTFWTLFLVFFFLLAVLGLAKWLYKFSERKNISSEKKNTPRNGLKYFLLFCLFLFSLSSFIFLDEMSHASPISKSVSSTGSSISNFLFFRERIMTSSSSEPIPLLNNSLKNFNIIFIVIDAVSSEHLPCYGYGRNVTPTIDWFCNNSLIFERAYSSATHTELSQTSLFSSLSPLRYESMDSFEEDYPRKFIWDSLKEQGYETAYFSSENDEWRNMIQFYNKTNLDVYSHSLSDGKTDYGFENFRKDHDESTTKSAINWIENSSKFFLGLGFHATHYPYSYPANTNRFFIPDNPSIFSTYLDVLEKDRVSDFNRYDNALRYVDKQIGVLKKYLEEKGLMNNTIIIITSDHGENLNYSDTSSFRHGYGIYEKEVHVPLLIYLPNQKKQIIEERVTQLDLVPTILNISGYNDFEGFQGKPFSENRTIFFMTQTYNFKIGMIKEDFKYIVNMNDYSYEVYNLLEDPKERNNLVKSFSKYEIPEGFSEKFSELLAWYDCQIDYYESKGYENGEILDCE